MATDKKRSQRLPAAQRRRTISGPRKDGRYVGAFYAPTTAGTYKRVYVYAKTWDQAATDWSRNSPRSSGAFPLPTNHGRLGPYLDYWLENIVR